MNNSNVTEMLSNSTPVYLVSDVKSIVFPVLAMVAVVLNVTILIVISRFCGKLNSHFVLVITQCSADLVISLGYFICQMVRLSTTLSILYKICILTFMTELINAAFLMSLVNILLITVDRFVAVWKPFKYSTMMRRSRVVRIVCGALVLTIMAFGASFIIAIFREGELGFCRQRLLSICYVTGKYLMMVDTIVLIVVYCYIIRTLRALPDDPSIASLRMSTRRATMTSLWIILTFMLCYWPDVISGYVRFPLPLYDLAKGLPFVNCASDPLIYAVRLHKIRAGYRLMLNKLRTCPQTDV